MHIGAAKRMPPLCFPTASRQVIAGHLLSAGGAGTSRALQRVVAVVGEIEGAAMHFAALDMRHPLLGRRALVQKVYSHYMRAAWPSLVRLLGSSSLLGMPPPLACRSRHEHPVSHPCGRDRRRPGPAKRRLQL